MCKMLKRFFLIALIVAMLFNTFSAGADSVVKNGATAITDMAISQIGYCEGYSGYSKYGEYFGRPYMPWCCAFVCWCARMCEFPESVVPTNITPASMRSFFMKKGMYKKAPYYGGTYIPKKGDLVFFSNARNQNNVSHIGIIEYADSSKMTCIEGNCPNYVVRINRTYTSYAVGFVTPSYSGDIQYETGEYVTKKAVNFRAAPYSSVITTIPSGVVLEIYKISEFWGKTIYNGKTGWLSLENSAYNPDKEPVEKKQYKAVTNIDVRSEPEASSDNKIGDIPAGTFIEVGKTKNNWGKISFALSADEKTSGWINLDLLVPFNPAEDWLLIDISKNQRLNEFDWLKLKEAGIKGAIICIGERTDGSCKIDERFLDWYKAAKEAGIYVGASFFSLAFNKDEAVEEAQNTIEFLKNNNCILDMPLFISTEKLEKSARFFKYGSAVCADIINGFCSTVEEAGYYAGIYCSFSFAETRLDNQFFEDRAAWIADFVENDKDNCSVYKGKTDIWQYSETASFAGAAGNMGLSHCYVNYPKLIGELNSINAGGNKYPKGDADKDGSVTAADARLILRRSVGLEEFDKAQKILSDIDKDKNISASDARSVLRISVGLDIQEKT